MTRTPGSRFAYAAVVADMDGVLVDAVEAYPDVGVVLDRWRRAGLGVAVACASNDCETVLEFAGLRERVDAVVDASSDPRLDRRALLRKAAQRVGCEPARAVALERDTAGIAAACEVGFGLVVGVDRNNGCADALARAGADRVVRDLGRLRFLRTLPSALDHRAELRERQGGRELALFLDYDGTLTPIVPNPADAVLSNAMRSCLASVAERARVAIVSGRDRPDVERRVGLAGLIYAGCHGFDIAGRGRHKILPEAEAALAEIDFAEQRLRAELADMPGAIVERKRFSVAAHYRMLAREADVETVRTIVDAVRRETGLRQRSGKMVLELEPPIDWNKGRAVEWCMKAFGINPHERMPVYIGDDETDEDGFAALAGVGIGIRVGPALSCSLADYRLDSPDEVRELLTWWFAG